MANKFIKAALLTAPGGERFIAFFDFDRLIKDIKAAQNFIVSVKMLTSVPAVVMYWSESDWRYLGAASHDSLIKYLMGLSEQEKSRISVSNAVLTIPASEIGEV
jgi:hypothetical protein